MNEIKKRNRLRKRKQPNWSKRIELFNQFAFEYPCLKDDIPLYDPDIATLVCDFQLRYSKLSIKQYSQEVKLFLRNILKCEQNNYYCNMKYYKLDYSNKARSEAMKAMKMISSRIKSLLNKK
jgi:hypothetical protein